MPNLEDLVPPLELCKRIPAGAFDDAFFAWVEYNRGEGWRRNWRYTRSESDAPFVVSPRFSAKEMRFHRIENPKNNDAAALFPAPTLAEILAALDSALDNVEAFSTEPRGLWCVKVDAGKFTERSECDVNPATAALKLWLRVQPEGAEE